MAEVLPPLDALRCFCEAARLLNFRAAARAVDLTPAALGQRIRQLEDLLEAKLFHRTTRTVQLTDAGKQLLPFAQQTLDAAQECLRLSGGEVGPTPVEIVLGTRHELGLSWIVPMLPKLQERNPGLTVHLYFGSGSDLVQRTRSHQIHCAVTSSVLAEPKLDSELLHLEEYVFVAAPSLVSELPLENESDAKEHVLIDISAGLPLYRYWKDSPEAFSATAFGATRRMGTIAAIRELVLRGKGVAVLPSYFVFDDLQAGDLVEVLPEVRATSDHFRLVFRADDPHRHLYEAIAEAMRVEPLR